MQAMAGNTLRWGTIFLRPHFYWSISQTRENLMQLIVWRIVRTNVFTTFCSSFTFICVQLMFFIFFYFLRRLAKGIKWEKYQLNSRLTESMGSQKK